MNSEAALELLRGVTDLYVAKGQKVVHFDLRDSASVDEQAVLASILGRSGTLRAPSLRVGPSFYVGYNSELLALIQ